MTHCWNLYGCLFANLFNIAQHHQALSNIALSALLVNLERFCPMPSNFIETEHCWTLQSTFQRPICWLLLEAPLRQVICTIVGSVISMTWGYACGFRFIWLQFLTNTIVIQQNPHGLRPRGFCCMLRFLWQFKTFWPKCLQICSCAPKAYYVVSLYFDHTRSPPCHWECVHYLRECSRCHWEYSQRQSVCYQCHWGYSQWYTHTDMHAYIDTYTHMHTYICMYVGARVCMCVCI